MKNFKITKNPFLIFLPFLLFYIAFVFLFNSSKLWGDEIRHMAYAQNLLHGFYSPASPDISLEVGPGYPLFILPFIAFHVPLIFVKLMNAILVYLSVVFVFKAIQQIASFKTALVFGLFLACYFNSFEFMPIMYAESLALFLVSVNTFLIIKAFSSDNLSKTNKYIYLAGIFIGFLALTKIIFGYVLLCMLFGSALLWILNRKSLNLRNCLFIFLTAIIITSPYLIYTYHLTNRVFYWGTSGGNNLYWMSTPYSGEYGNWIYDLKTGPPLPLAETGGDLNLKNRITTTPGSEDSLKKHHQKDYEEIKKYAGVAQDDAYRRIAINNIRRHPIKYIQNCFSNIGRILFNYPYSYTYQKPGTLLRFPLNGIIVVCVLFCLIPTLIYWKKIIFSIRCMLLMAFLYLGGSIFGSAEIRMFTIIVPILLVWFAFVLSKSIDIKKW